MMAEMQGISVSFYVETIYHHAKECLSAIQQHESREVAQKTEVSPQDSELVEGFAAELYLISPTQFRMIGSMIGDQP